MAILKWSDDYCSTIKNIDEQHMHLFDVINTFDENTDKTVSADALAQFLDLLFAGFEKLFKAEEKLMNQIKYPLTGHHLGTHELLLTNLKQINTPSKLKRRKERAYEQAISLATEWMLHMVRDDLLIFYYRKNINVPLPNWLPGKLCEVFSMDNESIVSGEILFISDNTTTISYRNKRIALKYDDLIKAAVHINDSENCYFIGRVYEKKDTTLTFFNDILVKTTDDRDFFRLSIYLDATISAGDESVRAQIINIGKEGALIETDSEFEADSSLLIEFSLLGTRFSKKFSIVRMFKKGFSRRYYGIKFTDYDESTVVLADHLSTLQSQHQRSMG